MPRRPSMPIYFLLSTGVLLSVGREPTPQAYSRGHPFYNALTGTGSGASAWLLLFEPWAQWARGLEPGASDSKPRRIVWQKGLALRDFLDNRSG